LRHVHARRASHGGSAKRSPRHRKRDVFRIGCPDRGDCGPQRSTSRLGRLRYREAVAAIECGCAGCDYPLVRLGTAPHQPAPRLVVCRQHDPLPLVPVRGDLSTPRTRGINYRSSRGDSAAPLCGAKPYVASHWIPSPTVSFAAPGGGRASTRLQARCLPMRGPTKRRQDLELALGSGGASGVSNRDGSLVSVKTQRLAREG